MDKIYDYVIVGAGPTGLTLAWLLSQYKKSVIIIEKEDYIGGCHGVKRINGLFSEHGPRIYIDNYFNFKNILNDMNLKFNDLFTPYKFGINDITSYGFKNLSLYEVFILLYTFLTAVLAPLWTAHHTCSRCFAFLANIITSSTHSSTRLRLSYFFFDS